jgi:branched-chain amino acid transport system substrate-binding protein
MKRSAIAVCCIGLGLAACKPEETLPPILIGAVVPQTGNLASYGPVMAVSAKLAVDQINAAGGVLDRQLLLKVVDDGSDPARTAEAVKSLKAEGAVVVTGVVASGSALAACPAATEVKIPLVVAIGSTPAYNALHATNPYCFRTRGSTVGEVKVVVSRLKALGKTKVGLLNIDNGYGNGFAASFKTIFAERGGTISKALVHKPGAANYDAELSELYASNPDAIVLAGYPPDGAQIVKDHIRLGNKPVFWYFGTPLMDTSFVTLAGANNFNFQHEGLGPPSPDTTEYRTFYDAFLADFGPADAQYYGYGAHMFDSVEVAVLAISAAGSLEADKIIAQVIELTRAGKKYGPQSFKEAAVAARAGEDIDFDGAAGNLDMDNTGDVAVAGFDLWQVKNNSISIQQRAVLP